MVALALAALVSLTVGCNLWWVAAHRRGLPFDIDEAGYLQRSIRDADALRSGGLSSFIRTVRLKDPQAPLLTAIAGIDRWLTGSGPYSLFAVEQIFYAIIIIATYFLSRQYMARTWSLLAAVMAAGIPGIVGASREFAFAIPATAMVTAALAVQVWAGNFRSILKSGIWGTFVGLSVLSRTVILAFIPALILPAILQALNRRADRTSVRNLLLGMIIGFGVAWSWYSSTWHVVLRYLTGYGYGSKAGSYGAAHSPLTLSWWLDRVDRAYNWEVFLPIGTALLLCAGAGLIRRQLLSTLHLKGALAHPATPVCVFLALGYLALSSSQNQGSSFELPLLPAAVTIGVLLGSRAVVRLRSGLAGICALAAIFSFTAVTAPLPGLTEGPVVAHLGLASPVVFDARPALTIRVTGMFVHCTTASRCKSDGNISQELRYYRLWVQPSRDMAQLIQLTALSAHVEPVVFFQVEDPLFNTNTVDLYYQLDFSRTLPTGLLRRPSDAHIAPLDQLENPKFGQPNVVVVGPPPVSSIARNFYPLLGQAAAVRVLVEDGFHPAGSIRLPDGRSMQVWLKPRGNPAAQ